ncbi:hypothetical protein [uncultured Helicobacter sp.]
MFAQAQTSKDTLQPSDTNLPKANCIENNKESRAIMRTYEYTHTRSR